MAKSNRARVLGGLPELTVVHVDAAPWGHIDHGHIDHGGVVNICSGRPQPPLAR